MVATLGKKQSIRVDAMKMNCKIATALVAGVAGVALVITAPASAADLKVISNGAMRGVVGGMIDDYSHKTGHKFQFTFSPPGCCATPSARASPPISSSPTRG
jgi:ABC-type molybdate transport system substrate-binding protein